MLVKLIKRFFNNYLTKRKKYKTVASSMPMPKNKLDIKSIDWAKRTVYDAEGREVIPAHSLFSQTDKESNIFRPWDNSGEEASKYYVSDPEPSSSNSDSGYSASSNDTDNSSSDSADYGGGDSGGSGSGGDW